MGGSIRTGAAAAGGLLAGLVIGFLVWGLGSREPAFSRTYVDGRRVRVAKVVDGDTIILDDGLHVRYRGCDAPEVSRFVREPEPFGDRATDRNRQLVEGTQVRLRFPSPEQNAVDKHGRLLAEVLLETGEGGAEESASEILVREGLARAKVYGLDATSRAILSAAEDEAKKAGRGMWGRGTVARAAGPFVASRSGKYIHTASCTFAKSISPKNLQKFDTLNSALTTGKQRCPTCFAPGGKAPAAPVAGPFVASREGKYIHTASCTFGKKISPKNLQRFDTLQVALATGKQRCPTCFASPGKVGAGRAAPARPPAARIAGPFLTSRSGKYAHTPSCTYAKLISPKNLQKFDTLNAALATGKQPCPMCFKSEAGAAAGRRMPGRSRGAQVAGPLVASRAGKYVHTTSCMAAKRISSKNLQKFDTLQAALAAGKQRCPMCSAPSGKAVADRRAPRRPSAARAAGPFVASRAGKYIHTASCTFGKNISPKNLQKFDTIQAALATGKQRCPTCFASAAKPTARAAPRPTAEGVAGPFVASRTGKYVHTTGCIFGKRISPENLQKFDKIDAAAVRGRQLCPTCFAPPGKRTGERGAAARPRVVFEDSFKDKLGKGWTWLRENRETWRIAGEALEIKVEPGVARTVRNALIRPVPDRSRKTFAVEVTVTFLTPPTKQYEQAGITWYRGGRPVFKLVHEQIDGKTYIIPGRIPAPSKTVQLRLIVTSNRYTAQFREDLKGEFRTAAKGGLRGGGKEQVSIQCYNGPADAEHWIRFDDFRIVELPAPGVKKPVARAAGAAPKVEAGPPFIASRAAKYVHRRGCIYTRRVSPANLQKFDTLEAAVVAGKQPCPTCFAPKKPEAKEKPK